MQKFTTYHFSLQNLSRIKHHHLFLCWRTDRVSALFTQNKSSPEKESRRQQQQQQLKSPHHSFYQRRSLISDFMSLRGVNQASCAITSPDKQQKDPQKHLSWQFNSGFPLQELAYDASVVHKKARHCGEVRLILLRESGSRKEALRRAPTLMELMQLGGNALAFSALGSPRTRRGSRPPPIGPRGSRHGPTAREVVGFSQFVVIPPRVWSMTTRQALVLLCNSFQPCRRKSFSFFNFHQKGA